MKVAVFGWYGHENAGDERIKFCLNQFLSNFNEIEKVDFFDLHTHAIKGPTDKFNEYDLVIVGGGGLILSHHNYHDFILGIKTKVITAGVSVEVELTGNPRKFAQALLNKSSSFIVRDHGSYEKLRNLEGSDKVIVSADLTFLVPFDIVPKALNQGAIGVNLQAKINGSKGKLALLKYFPALHRVISLPVLDYKELVERLKNLGELVPIPLYCIKQDEKSSGYMMNDVNTLRKYFKEVSKGFNHEAIDKCQIFMSMRLHGLIFAVQKGIPLLTLENYPKQTNFLKEIGIQDCLVGMNDLQQIESFVQKIALNKEDYRNKIISYRNQSVRKITTDLRDAISSVLKT